MSDIRFLAAAAVVAQVDKFTPANVEVTDIFTLTATGLDGTTASVSFVATAATVANVTAGLTAAWNASTNALHTPITAADETTYMTLTADVPGVAFSVAASTADGGGTDDQTLTRAVVTKNEGPSDWSSADNWSGGAVPGGAANQDIYIEDSSVDILYGLDQSGIANTLDSLNIGQSYTGHIGSNGAAGIAADYLQIKATAVNIGQHYGSGTPGGSGRIKLDLGATQSAVTIHHTGTPADSYKPSVRLKCNNAATTLEVRKGKVGVAVEAGETSTISIINGNYVNNKNTDADVFIGEGVTLTTLNQKGGEIVQQCAATTINTEGGKLTTAGSGAVATMNVKGGEVISNSTGTITTLHIMSGGVADFTKSMAARTITNLKVEVGGKIKGFGEDYLTVTNVLKPDEPVILTATAA